MARVRELLGTGGNDRFHSCRTHTVSHTLQSGLLCPVGPSFRFNREIKSFTDKQKLREFSTTNPKVTSLGRKEKATTRFKKITNRELTSKGKHRVRKSSTHKYIKDSNHEKKRVWVQDIGNVRDQQLKTIWYIYRLLYQNLMGATNQKSTADTHTKKKKQYKHITKDRHQITGEGEKRPSKIPKTIDKMVKGSYI